MEGNLKDLDNLLKGITEAVEEENDYSLPKSEPKADQEESPEKAIFENEKPIEETPIPEPVQIPINGEEIAAGIVGFLSNAIDIGGQFAYPSIILEEGDAVKLAELDRIVKLGRPPLDESEIIKEECKEDSELLDALTRWRKCHKAIKGAPFTETEKKTLIGPLSKVVEKYAFLQVGPEMLLLFAVVIVMAPRITPLFPGFSSFLSSSLIRVKEEK